MDIKKAELAIDQLLTAYAKGELSDSHIRWVDLDNAFECARAAWPGRYEEIIAAHKAELICGYCNVEHTEDEIENQTWQQWQCLSCSSWNDKDQPTPPAP